MMKTKNENTQHYSYNHSRRLPSNLEVFQPALPPAKKISLSVISLLFTILFSGGANAAPAPSDIIKRNEIAKPILLARHGSSHIPASALGIYTDVAATDFDADWIEGLRSEGITKGCDEDNSLFCPETAVTKEQLANILIRAKYGFFTPPPPPALGTVFNDISKTTFSAGRIEQLKNELITEGCDASNYCPKEAVTWDVFNKLLTATFP